MKKALVVVLALVLMSSFALAESSNWNLGLGIGYAMPSMQKVNNNLNYIHSVFSTTSETKISGALDANLDLMYQTTSFLQIGPRVGLIKASQGIISGGSDYMHTDCMLIPAQIGAALDIRLKDVPFGIIIEGFGGYGFSFLDSNNKLSGITSSSDYYGGAPVFDFLGGIEITPLSFFTIKGSIGYEVANISTLKATANATNNSNIHKGDTLKTSDTNENLPVDFSGINFKLGVSFKF
jgi:opacity protein-like surface antigen